MDFSQPGAPRLRRRQLDRAAFGGRRFLGFRFKLTERRAAKIAGFLLFTLAGFVVVTSVLNFLGYRQAQRSPVGIGILLAAAFVMPWLANRKRQLAVVTSSAALKADAAESALCRYMAWIAMAGLCVNAVWHAPWADPVAALALVPLNWRGRVVISPCLEV